MRYLVDTNEWSYLQERHPTVVARFEGLSGEDSLFMSVISQAELLGGIALVKSERRQQELFALYQKVVTMATEILPITSEVAEEFAQIFASLRRKGRPIETNDMWLAATARTHDLILVSSDGHFQHVDGLHLEDWTKPIGPES